MVWRGEAHLHGLRGRSHRIAPTPTVGVDLCVYPLQSAGRLAVGVDLCVYPLQSAGRLAIPPLFEGGG